MPDTQRNSSDTLVTRIDDALRAFLDGRRTGLTTVSPDLVPVMDATEDFVRQGGKRLRPVFALWGHVAAGGTVADAVVTACSALELLHACALVHDDVMDGSDVRRGRPSLHRRMEAEHRLLGWTGSAGTFGVAAAILVGDLLLSWSDEMLHTSGLPTATVAAARPVWDEMRTELMAGQYLDMVEQARGVADLDRALLVARYKSGKYTVERPLHLGAALAGRAPDSPTGRALSAYGLPLGEAFQLRDDVLGVFGDPSRTGKPAGDDLREGKRTVLVAAALQRAAPEPASELRDGLGRRDLGDDGVRRLCSLVEASGALAYVEELIAVRTRLALAALDDPAIDPRARPALTDLARAATTRSG